MTLFSYDEGDEAPDIALWWANSAGVLRDFSSGWTFEVKVGLVAQPAVITKTTGITGAAGSGTPPSGVPNLVISWTSSDLGALTVPAGLVSVTYGMWVKGTNGGRDYHYPGQLGIVLSKTAT